MHVILIKWGKFLLELRRCYIEAEEGLVKEIQMNFNRFKEYVTNNIYNIHNGHNVQNMFNNNNKIYNKIY